LRLVVIVIVKFKFYKIPIVVCWLFGVGVCWVLGLVGCYCYVKNKFYKIHIWGWGL